MSENKIQVSSIQNQIDSQISLIKNLSIEKEKIDSDLTLAKEFLGFLQSKLKQPQNEISDTINSSEKENIDNSIKRTKRANTKPSIVDENVIIALSTNSETGDGMTNAEIERFLIREKDLLISKNGIQAGLNRLIDKKLVKITNPSESRNIRFALI